jgi:hypothetical protein
LLPAFERSSIDKAFFWRSRQSLAISNLRNSRPLYVPFETRGYLPLLRSEPKITLS